jgi:hypothetical protein
MSDEVRHGGLDPFFGCLAENKSDLVSGRSLEGSNHWSSKSTHYKKQLDI